MPTSVLEPELETVVQEEPVQDEAPQPASRKDRIRNLLMTMFAGHEEFLGWTPD